MVLAHNNTVFLVNREQFTFGNAQYEFASTSGKNFVLMNDITLTSHTPIVDFQGNFYGNGHTVTITGMTAADNMGLFGTTNNALIRDLTVVYDGMPDINTSATNVGGIIGNASGTTTILNCIVRGASSTDTLTFTGSGNTVRIGGIAGNFNGYIENCRAALSVAYNSDGANVYIGGIAGELGTGSGGSIVINGVTITANITSTDTGEDTSGYIGGAVGSSGQSTINNIEYTGSISFDFNNAEFYSIGGILGQSFNTNIINCHFSSAMRTIRNEQVVSHILYIGGLIGIKGTYGNYHITNCTVQGNFDLKTIAFEEHCFGGVIGYSNSSGGTIAITNTFFNEGNINIKSNSIYLGGFIGYMTRNHNINNCGPKAGTINFEYDSDGYDDYDNSFIGGFSSRFSGSGGNISNCFSGIDIRANSSFRVGGFLAFTDATINNCYSTGTVQIQSIPSYQADGDNVGGFIGLLLLGTVSNCYALGNVLVDTSGAGNLINAGGLVGFNDDGNITNCFTAGQVSVQSTVPPVYAGGIVGYGRSTSSRISNSVALGSSATVKSPDTDSSVGRISGRFWTGNGASGNRANESMRVENSSIYNDPNPPALVFDTIPPVMSGSPVLQRNIEQAVISGLHISDLGGSGLANSSMSNAAMSVTRNPVSAGGSPVWDGSRISGIDLSDLSDTTHSLRFDITLHDNAGNSAVYCVEVRPNIANPTTLADFSVTLSSTPISTSINHSTHDSQHGLSVSSSTFNNPGFWTDLGFTTTNWNFARVGSEGFPRLAWE
jgi:hypothetical protein